MATRKRGMSDCAFCRTPCPDNDVDRLALLQARVEKKDPAAIYFLGEQYFFGALGLPKDVRKAAELYAKAAELGSVEALHSLELAYYSGEGVEQDEAKGAEFYKKAAMQGSVESRYNLGNHEGRKGNHDRAGKHFLISAKMGHKDSVETIKNLLW